MNFKNIPAAAKIIVGMLLGIALGGYFQYVFMGVAAIGDGFIMLLQMTALPYITLSLITSIGALSPDSAKKTAKFGVALFIVLLSTMMVFILLIPIAFPDWQSASFYSANTIKSAPEVNFLKLLIPKNPFFAYANAVIPSVVVFSILLGAGLIRIKSKRSTIQVLNNLLTSVANMNSMVMKLAPIGVFCIAYKAAATIESGQIDGLMVYVTSTFFVVCIVSFLLLPAAIAAATPFTYSEVIKTSRAALLTGFATGSFFSILPTIIEDTKTKLEKLPKIGKGIENSPGIIVPITYSLPVGGKLITFIFVLFAAWFSGTGLSINEYAKLVFVGLPNLFGSSTAATAVMLNLFNIDTNLLDLYIVSDNIIVGRLGVIFSIMFSTCFTLLIGAFIAGALKFNWKYAAKHSIIVIACFVLSLALLRNVFEQISHQYQGYEKFVDRDFLYLNLTHEVYETPASDAAVKRPFVDVLTRIKQRGLLRVGYFIDDLPYSFHNKDGDLVGFDIEILQLLAKDLHVDIEFVRILRNQAQPFLNSGYLDMTTGVPLLPDNMNHFTLTTSYSEQVVGILVKNDRRAEFSNWIDIFERKGLNIAIPETFYYKDQIERYFVRSTVRKFETPRLLFREKYQYMDGMLFGAAAASAWSLLYPEYTVVVPKPIQPPVLMAFPINKNDHRFELFMRRWIEMKKQNGVIGRLFKYWIEGKDRKSINRVADAVNNLPENN